MVRRSLANRIEAVTGKPGFFFQIPKALNMTKRKKACTECRQQKVSRLLYARGNLF